MIRREDKLAGTYTRYDYTSENQLIRVSEFPTLLSTTPTKETNYYFDALNRRMAKVSTDFVDSNNSFTRKYIYDGEEILAEFDGSNNLLARYTHSSLRTDDILSMDVTASGVTRNVASIAGSYYYLKDHLGTIKHVTNSIGDIVQTINYSAYGVITSIKDALGNDISSNPLVQVFHSFTGREFDRETGLYFYRARFYDSSTGRFLQQDPNPGKMDLPLTVINRYGYTSNNPLNFIDPDGEFILTALVVSFVVGATVAAFQPGANFGSILTAGTLTALSTGLVLAGSAGAVALGASFGATSLGAQIVLGALGGAIGGAIIPAAFGGSSAQIAFGAIAGAISGGIIGGTLRAFPNAQGADALNVIDSTSRSVTPSVPEYNFFAPQQESIPIHGPN